MHVDQVDVGKRDRPGGAQRPGERIHRAVFRHPARAVGAQRDDRRRVVGAGDRDRLGLGDSGALDVLDLIADHDGGGLALGQVVEGQVGWIDAQGATGQAEAGRSRAGGPAAIHCVRHVDDRQRRSLAGVRVSRTRQQIAGEERTGFIRVVAERAHHCRGVVGTREIDGVGLGDGRRDTVPYRDGEALGLRLTRGEGIHLGAVGHVQVVAAGGVDVEGAVAAGLADVVGDHPLGVAAAGGATADAIGEGLQVFVGTDQGAAEAGVGPGAAVGLIDFGHAAGGDVLQRRRHIDALHADVRRGGDTLCAVGIERHHGDFAQHAFGRRVAAVGVLDAAHADLELRDVAAGRISAFEQHAVLVRRDGGGDAEARQDGDDVGADRQGFGAAVLGVGEVDLDAADEAVLVEQGGLVGGDVGDRRLLLDEAGQVVALDVGVQRQAGLAARAVEVDHRVPVDADGQRGAGGQRRRVVAGQRGADVGDGDVDGAVAGEGVLIGVEVAQRGQRGLVGGHRAGAADGERAVGGAVARDGQGVAVGRESAAALGGEQRLVNHLAEVVERVVGVEGEADPGDKVAVVLVGQHELVEIAGLVLGEQRHRVATDVEHDGRVDTRDGPVEVENRRVIGAGEGHGDVLAGKAAVAVIDGDGEHRGDAVALAEEVHIGFGDGVGPVDAAVVVVGATRGEREGVGERGDLAGAQGERGRAVVLERVEGLEDVAGRRQVGEVEVGKGDRAGVGQGAGTADFAKFAGNVDRTDHGHVVGAVEGHRDVLVDHAALPVIDRDGEHRGDLLAGGEEVHLGLGDAVVPADGAVVGVGDIRGEGEGGADGGLLRATEDERRETVGLDRADRRDREGGGGQVGDVDIGEADRAAVAEQAAAAGFADRAGHVGGAEERNVVGAGDGDDEVLADHGAVAVVDGHGVGEGQGLTSGEVVEGRGLGAEAEVDRAGTAAGGLAHHARGDEGDEPRVVEGEASGLAGGDHGGDAGAVAHVGEVGVGEADRDRGGEGRGVGLLVEVGLGDDADHRYIVGAGDVDGDRLRGAGAVQVGHADRVGQGERLAVGKIIEGLVVGLRRRVVGQNRHRADMRAHPHEQGIVVGREVGHELGRGRVEIPVEGAVVVGRVDDRAGIHVQHGAQRGVVGGEAAGGAAGDDRHHAGRHTVREVHIDHRQGAAGGDGGVGLADVGGVAVGHADGDDRGVVGAGDRHRQRGAAGGTTAVAHGVGEDLGQRVTAGAQRLHGGVVVVHLVLVAAVGVQDETAVLAFEGAAHDARAGSEADRGDRLRFGLGRVGRLVEVRVGVVVEDVADRARARRAVEQAAGLADAVDVGHGGRGVIDRHDVDGGGRSDTDVVLHVDGGDIHVADEGLGRRVGGAAVLDRAQAELEHRTIGVAREGDGVVVTAHHRGDALALQQGHHRGADGQPVGRADRGVGVAAAQADLHLLDVAVEVGDAGIGCGDGKRRAVLGVGDGVAAVIHVGRGFAVEVDHRSPDHGEGGAGHRGEAVVGVVGAVGAGGDRAVLDGDGDGAGTGGGVGVGVVVEDGAQRRLVLGPRAGTDEAQLGGAVAGHHQVGAGVAGVVVGKGEAHLTIDGDDGRTGGGEGLVAAEQVVEGTAGDGDGGHRDGVGHPGDLVRIEDGDVAVHHLHRNVAAGGVGRGVGGAGGAAGTIGVEVDGRGVVDRGDVHRDGAEGHHRLAGGGHVLQRHAEGVAGVVVELAGVVERGGAADEGGKVGQGAGEGQGAAGAATHRDATTAGGGEDGADGARSDGQGVGVGADAVHVGERQGAEVDRGGDILGHAGAGRQAGAGGGVVGAMHRDGERLGAGEVGGVLEGVVEGVVGGIAGPQGLDGAAVVEQRVGVITGGQVDTELAVGAIQHHVVGVERIELGRGAEARDAAGAHAVEGEGVARVGVGGAGQQVAGRAAAGHRVGDATGFGDFGGLHRRDRRHGAELDRGRVGGADGGGEALVVGVAHLDADGLAAFVVGERVGVGGARLHRRAISLPGVGGAGADEAIGVGQGGGQGVAGGRGAADRHGAGVILQGHLDGRRGDRRLEDVAAVGVVGGDADVLVGLGEPQGELVGGRAGDGGPAAHAVGGHLPLVGDRRVVAVDVAHGGGEHRAGRVDAARRRGVGRDADRAGVVGGFHAVAGGTVGEADAEGAGGAAAVAVRRGEQDVDVRRAARRGAGELELRAVPAHPGRQRVAAGLGRGDGEDIAVHVGEDVAGQGDTGLDVGEGLVTHRVGEHRRIIDRQQVVAEVGGEGVHAVADAVAEDDLAVVVEGRRDGVGAVAVVGDGAVVGGQANHHEGLAFGVGVALQQLGEGDDLGHILIHAGEHRRRAGEGRRIVGVGHVDGEGIAGVADRVLLDLELEVDAAGKVGVGLEAELAGDDVVHRHPVAHFTGGQRRGAGRQARRVGHIAGRDRQAVEPEGALGGQCGDDDVVLGAALRVGVFAEVPHRQHDRGVLERRDAVVGGAGRGGDGEQEGGRDAGTGGAGAVVGGDLDADGAHHGVIRSAAELAGERVEDEPRGQRRAVGEGRGVVERGAVGLAEMAGHRERRDRGALQRDDVVEGDGEPGRVIGGVQHELQGGGGAGALPVEQVVAEGDGAVVVGLRLDGVGAVAVVDHAAVVGLQVDH